MYSPWSLLVVTEAQQHKINDFQHRCLSKICGIAPSCVFRTSNVFVLAEAQYAVATNPLRKRLLWPFGKVYCAPERHPLIVALFILNTTSPAKRFVHGPERPSKQWMREYMLQAIYSAVSLKKATSPAPLDNIVNHIAILFDSANPLAFCLVLPQSTCTFRGLFGCVCRQDRF